MKIIYRIDVELDLAEHPMDLEDEATFQRVKEQALKLCEVHVDRWHGAARDHQKNARLMREAHEKNQPQGGKP